LGIGIAVYVSLASCILRGQRAVWIEERIGRIPARYGTA